MFHSAMHRPGWLPYVSSVVFVGLMSTTAPAIPSFQSVDWRLPNPDRPYDMTSGTVLYDTPSLYDLKIQIADPSQLDTPTFNPDSGLLEFDSTFDVNFTATVSRSLEPSYLVSGVGTARAVGKSRPSAPLDFAVPYVQVFDTELVSLSLLPSSPLPDLMFRESPTLMSNGVTIREDVCPVCASPITFWNISSFFDILTEVTFDGGTTWSAADKAIHIEQAPDGSSPGDYNNDKVVDAGDYLVWRTTRGQIGAGLAADGDWSGKVDAGDLAVWQANFGRVNGFLHGSPAAAAVPEPAGWLVLLSAAFAACSMRRRWAIGLRPPRHA